MTNPTIVEDLAQASFGENGESPNCVSLPTAMMKWPSLAYPGRAAYGRVWTKPEIVQQTHP